MLLRPVQPKARTLEELKKPLTMGDLVDSGGNTGGLEEVAKAWKFLGVLESADHRSVGYLGTLE